MTHSPKSLAITAAGLALMSFLMLAAAEVIAAPDTAAPVKEDASSRFPIPVEELEARRTMIFVEIDVNGDGLISPEEFDSHEPPRRGRTASFAMRGNTPHAGSGKTHPRTGDMATPVSRHFPIADEQMFNALDVDGDGVLSVEEFSSEAMAAARMEMMKERMFARMDRDGDGYLSTEEFPPPGLVLMDTHADGQISRSEMRHRHGRPDAD